MAEVRLRIGDRDHRIACADGQEAQLERLGAIVAERWAPARQASGGLSDERTLLFVALMLADALSDAAPPAPADNHAALEQLAIRLEAIADALEDHAPTA